MKAGKPPDVRQLDLLGPSPEPSRQPDLDYLMVLPGVPEVIDYAMRLAKLVPKQLYSAMGKDKTTWSRIVSGEIDFPAADIEKFSRRVGNDALSLYVAHACGWDIKAMRKARDDSQRRIAELEQQLAEAQREKELIRNWVRETMR